MAKERNQNDTLNLSNLEESLLRIIQADDATVIAINGKWGEGKTYFWKYLVERHPFLRHSGYISVFGAESLNEIREKIVFSAFKNPKWTQWLLNTWLFQLPIKFLNIPLTQRYWQLLKTNCPPLVLLLKWAAKSFSNIFTRWPRYIRALIQPSALQVQMLEDSFLKEGWLICIDDVERLPKAVEIEQLMGLIAELRDDRKLKIVLIYNDQKLGEKEEAFSILSEKVIDRRLPYSPSTADVVNLVFGKKYPIYVQKLTHRCDLIEMRNIRLLYRVKNYYEEFVLVLPSPIDNEVISDKLYKILLYVWVHHTQKKDSWITLDKLIDFEAYSFALNENEENQDKRKFVDFAEEYGYLHTDELDELLINFVNSDILDEKTAVEIYNKMAGEKGGYEQDKKYSEVWKKLFHGTLSDNSQEFTEKLFSATENYISRISINSLDQALATLEVLGEPSKATKLFDMFVEYHDERIDKSFFSFLISPLKYNRFIQYRKIVEDRFENDERSLENLLNEIVENNHISTRDKSRLNSFPVTAFVDYLTSTEKPEVTSFMRRLDALGVTQIQGAASEISKMSEISRRRMEAMGLVKEVI